MMGVTTHKKKIKKNEKGKEIKLRAQWKGWRDKRKGWRDKNSITMEPLQNMVEDWPDKVKHYCEKNHEMEEICHRDILFQWIIPLKHDIQLNITIK